MKKLNRELTENEEKHYVGNVFGWKFSFAGLFIIIFFVVFAWYRKTYHSDTEYRSENPALIEDTLSHD